MGEHSHSHHHGHHHSHAYGQSFNTAFLFAAILTLGYALLEGGYAIYAHSMSLLADAVHNLGDTLGLIMAGIANWLLTLPAKKRYSYGFKRTSILAALSNAFLLVATSAVIAYESFYKLYHLTAINEQIVIVIGCIGIVVNILASLVFMKGAKEDLNIKGAFLHLLSDAMILAGVVLAAIVIHFTNWIWIDPVLGLIIVGIVLVGTWGLLRDSIILLLDAIPHHIDHHGVKEYLAQLPGVKAVHDLHIWGLSTREVALTAHLIMPNQPLTDADYRKINDDLHHQFKINHATLQVENGSTDDPCQRTVTC